MNKIGFIIKDREIQTNGMVKVSVSLLNSTKEQLSTNELPIILNSIKRSDYLDPSTHKGFDYTLDFPLEPGFGFPYALDCELEEERNRNIV